MSLYADYLLHAGATVVPMRPVGHQVNKVVLDNESPGVTFTGSGNCENSPALGHALEQFSGWKFDNSAL